jgi:nicotinate-nucleotide pyrophosphorylase (carboxylating)
MTINKDLIKQALKEDIGAGDITTRALIPPQLKIDAAIITKQNGVIAGLNIAKAVFTALDRNTKVKLLVNDGDRIASGRKIIRISGKARPILAAERTALNFLGHLSGIATLTRRFVDAVRPYKVQILDTRKTTPGLRIAEKYAVKCGGGKNHRIGLWDEALIKDNHIAVVGRQSIADSKRKNILEKMIKEARKNIPKNKPIEIEVKDLRGLKGALIALPDIILLDNMSISQIKKAVEIRNKFLLSTIDCSLSTVLFEVSGGVNLANVRRIARTGVDRISVGSLTHSAPALDLSLKII